MRFSKNGYYIEKYIKCYNCGLLIYDAGVTSERKGKPQIFCSDWCVQWSALRELGRGEHQAQAAARSADGRAQSAAANVASISASRGAAGSDSQSRAAYALARSNASTASRSSLISVAAMLSAS